MSPRLAFLPDGIYTTTRRGEPTDLISTPAKDCPLNRPLKLRRGKTDGGGPLGGLRGVSVGGGKGAWKGGHPCDSAAHGPSTDSRGTLVVGGEVEGGFLMGSTRRR